MLVQTLTTRNVPGQYRALRTAAWLGLLALLALDGRGAETLRVRGRVVAEGAGEPLPDVPVGAIRLAQVARLGPARSARAERQVVTDDDGRFSIEVAADTPGIDRVAVFTLSPGHANRVLDTVAFGGRLPTVADLSRPEVRVVDFRLQADLGDIALREAPGWRQTSMVPMRDQVRLATDAYLPEGTGPWPVILMRTPYNRRRSAFGTAQRLTEAGYVLVYQDVRGRFASEGENLAFQFDAWGQQQDGVDTMKWVLLQPWCNRKIGTNGGSALGITQVLTAAAQPPGLVCQSLSVACGSLYHHAAYVGGAFSKALVEDWLGQNRFAPKCLEQMRSHPLYDEFWRGLDSGTRADQVTVPGLFIGGWYDVFSQGTLDAFVWRQEQSGPGARGRQKLIMGAWCHGREKTGELAYPAASKRTPAPFDGLAWFDYWLQGKPTNVETAPAITYYVMGAVDEPGAPGHEWRHADQWPVVARPTAFFLRSDRSVSAEAETTSTPLTFEFDPDKPVPTRGGNNLTIASGPMDQRPVEDRPDVLLFTSAPLTEPLEITGRVTVRLWISSTAPDTDITAKLTDVYPDGRSMLVLDGIRRLRFRNGFDKEELLQPGEVYAVSVDLWSTSLILNRGHRWRVAVSSSNYPRFDVNPNTGADLRHDGPRQKARNTLHLGGSQPSQVLLPVVRTGP